MKRLSRFIKLMPEGFKCAVPTIIWAAFLPPHIMYPDVTWLRAVALSLPILGIFAMIAIIIHLAVGPIIRAWKKSKDPEPNTTEHHPFGTIHHHDPNELKPDVKPTGTGHFES